MLGREHKDEVRLAGEISWACWIWRPFYTEEEGSEAHTSFSDRETEKQFGLPKVILLVNVRADALTQDWMTRKLRLPPTKPGYFP